MKELIHGGDIYSFNKNIIDFSANINPLGMPLSVKKAIIDNIENYKAYPDPLCRSLRKALAKKEKTSMENILCGNGAADIIFKIALGIKPKKALILAPTFSEYERGARLNNLEVINFMLNKDDEFSVNLDEIEEKIDEFDSLFICNPNNPNGKVKNIEKLLELMSKHNKLLIVDETFMEFVYEEEKYSLIKYINKYENLFILKAVTKFFGMPGLRLGYGVTSNKKLIENIYKYKEPWTVNSFADTLSNYIFNDKDYINNSKAYYLKERKYMLNALRKIKRLKAYDTDTNFILIKLEDKKAEELKLQLFKESNILIRDASNFVNLDESYIRIAIKGHNENQLILKELNRIMGE